MGAPNKSIDFASREWKLFKSMMKFKIVAFIFLYFCLFQNISAGWCNDIESYISSARIAEAKGDLPTAIRYYELVLRADPTFSTKLSIEAQRGLSRCKKSLEKEKKEKEEKEERKISIEKNLAYVKNLFFGSSESQKAISGFRISGGYGYDQTRATNIYNSTVLAHSGILAIKIGFSPVVINLSASAGSGYGYIPDSIGTGPMIWTTLGLDYYFLHSRYMTGQ